MMISLNLFTNFKFILKKSRIKSNGCKQSVQYLVEKIEDVQCKNKWINGAETLTLMIT